MNIKKCKNFIKWWEDTGKNKKSKRQLSKEMDKSRKVHNDAKDGS